MLDGGYHEKRELDLYVVSQEHVLLRPVREVERFLSPRRETVLPEAREVLMYTSISVVLTLVLGLIGIVDFRLRQTKPLVALSSRSQDRPIMDPDHGSGRSFEQDKPRIDRFAKAMKENRSADAYIIAYAGLVSYKNEARIRLTCTRKYLITTHEISPSRLKLIDGGYSVEKEVQLFLVNPGDPKPTASPFVNREAVRITKAPKYRCGKPGAFRRITMR